MKDLNILAVCAHGEILETIVRLVNGHPGWRAVGATDTEQTIRMLEASEYDIILLGSGLDAESEVNLAGMCRKLRPQMKIVYHFGGGSGLLANEILGALAADNA